MEQTFELFGENPYTLEAGIEETVNWLKSYEGDNGSGGGF
jgi:hypothetical protein